MLTFIETSYFTKKLVQLLDDEKYRLLQTELIKDPEKGSMIRSCGGLRKIRWSIDNNKGKSGGVRILYYYVSHAGKIHMIAIYPKSAKDSLTNEEKAIFRNLIKSEFGNGQ